MRRILRWAAWLIGILAVALIVAAIATARSGDDTLYPPAPDATRVEVFVVANFHHSGIILPREALAEAARREALPALAAVTERFAGYERLEFGWGDEAFYTRVPTTNALTTALALRALFRPGNPSVLHVVGLHQHPRLAYLSASMVAVTLGEDGFARLAAMLDATFARSGTDGTIEELGRGLYGPSLFFRAVGTFNVFRVCNHWVADLLDAAGVPTAPLVATLPQGLLWDLTARTGAVRLSPGAR
ncbi:MAG: DUF2459 domain-containing protein [Rhizobiales bacterium]|nr:DUF2459 domain-containing protein [Hyphomicrobiales bacterium]